jgi:hypothetical protein
MYYHSYSQKKYNGIQPWETLKPNVCNKILFSKITYIERPFGGATCEHCLVRRFDAVYQCHCKSNISRSYIFFCNNCFKSYHASARSEMQNVVEKFLLFRRANVSLLDELKIYCFQLLKIYFNQLDIGNISHYTSQKELFCDERLFNTLCYNTVNNHDVYYKNKSEYSFGFSRYDDGYYDD